MQCNRKIGGLARAAILTPERRSEIAKIAATKRWNNQRKIDELAVKIKPHIFQCNGVWFCKSSKSLWVLCKSTKKSIWRLVATSFPNENP